VPLTGTDLSGQSASRARQSPRPPSDEYGYSGAELVSGWFLEGRHSIRRIVSGRVFVGKMQGKARFVTVALNPVREDTCGTGVTRSRILFRYPRWVRCPFSRISNARFTQCAGIFSGSESRCSADFVTTWRFFRSFDEGTKPQVPLRPAADSWPGQ
jgi:hypothetical protein